MDKSPKKPRAKITPRKGTRSSDKDSFESVAARLGCDPDLKKFDKKMGKIAKAGVKKSK